MAAPQEPLFCIPCKDSMGVGTSVTEVWKLLCPPPMERKPSDLFSLRPLPIYERCSDTGNNLGFCMEVHTKFQWFLALAGLCLRYL